MRHTSARSAQFLRVFVGIGLVFFEFRRCVFRTPPRVLHSKYQCDLRFGMFSFNFGGALFAHLRAFCTVNTNAICVSEMRPTWDFIILNKGRMTPPWREKAKRSQGQRRVQNFNPICVPSRARLDVPKTVSHRIVHFAL